MQGEGQQGPAGCLPGPEAQVPGDLQPGGQQPGECLAAGLRLVLCGLHYHPAAAQPPPLPQLPLAHSPLALQDQGERQVGLRWGGGGAMISVAD